MIFRILFMLAVSNRLEMNRYFFRLQWCLFDFPVYTIKGNTTDINKIELDVSVGSQGKETILVLFEKVLKVMRSVRG